MNDPSQGHEQIGVRLHVIDEDDCWQLLESHNVGRLAVTVGTQPEIFPVNYKVHEGEIVIRTEAGTKMAAALLNSAVAFEIDEIDQEHRSGWSVVVTGHAREPQQLEEIVHLDDVQMDLWVHDHGSRWLLIKPLTVSGRRVP